MYFGTFTYSTLFSMPTRPSLSEITKNSSDHPRSPSSIIIDTGTEISILSSEFVASLFPDDDLSTNTRAVRNLGGGLVSLYGPVELTIVVCGLTLEHPFFYYEDNPTFLMGIDLLTRAALTIDCESLCVWSKHTLRFHVRQDLEDATAKPTLHVNADKFLDTVSSLPALFPDVETRESWDVAMATNFVS